MIYVSAYVIEYDQRKDEYIVLAKETPVCPKCSGVLSGYDSRRRHVIDDTGGKIWYRARRLRCGACGALHVVLPDFMITYKHYSKQAITTAQTAKNGYCPADDSTIRRWKKEVHPPSLPSFYQRGDIPLNRTVTKEERK